MLLGIKNVSKKATSYKLFSITAEWSSSKENMFLLILARRRIA
jgi:hypothetical protein